MKTLADIPDLNGKKVLMRTDLDVPVGEDGKIQETFRIKRQKECLDYLRGHGAQVALIAHISAVPSFELIKQQIEEILGPIDLRENLRANPGEEANDMEYAKQLADGFDLYVNNAFAVCHRNHASIATLPTLLPSYAGPLIVQETEQLQKVIDAPAQGKIIFIGGAKISTKMPVIEHFLDKAQAIAVGSAIAAQMQGPLDSHIVMPTDYVYDEGVARDIGPQTGQAFAELARQATLVVWNGPMGKFEDDRFMPGTRILAEAIAASSADTVIGGGDTISAVDKLGLLDRMGFVSTGGGAMLDFLAGQSLPGLVALGW